MVLYVLSKIKIYSDSEFTHEYERKVPYVLSKIQIYVF